MARACAALPTLVLSAMSVCWCAPSQIVTAPDGSERRIDWENAAISTDALILYTASWGPASPGHRWTRTVVVREGEVVEVIPSGPAPIPEDGFLLIGHGAAAGWLRDHLREGSAVRVRPVPPFPEERWEREVDRVDPDVAEFPSGRGPNQLVVYTPGFGSRTGTNIFGSESIVRQGRIVERTDGDSLIPDDGFVISGHGRGSAGNMRCCPVGARVELEGTHLTVIRDEET